MIIDADRGAPTDADPCTRPHGLLLIRLKDAGAATLIALNGHEFLVAEQITIYGERPRDQPEVIGQGGLGRLGLAESDTIVERVHDP